MAYRHAFKPPITMVPSVLILLTSFLGASLAISRPVDLNFLKNEHPLKDLPAFKRFVRAAEALEQYQDPTEVPVDPERLKMLNLPHTDSFDVVAFNLSSQPRGPLHRFRRTLCDVPLKLKAKVDELTSTLNDTLYYGFLPYTDRIKMDAQPHTDCPRPTKSWWPQREDNLRSHCPWTFGIKDMGEMSYPRYVPTAKCNCVVCLMPTSYGCDELKYVFTYFKVTSCVDDVALVSKKTDLVTTGCFCVAPETEKPNPLRIPMVTPPNYF